MLNNMKIKTTCHQRSHVLCPKGGICSPVVFVSRGLHFQVSLYLVHITIRKVLIIILPFVSGLGNFEITVEHETTGGLTTEVESKWPQSVKAEQDKYVKLSYLSLRSC